ncbi:hypothetical protein DKX38_026022 [Salix brachista]|uniref:Glutathione S-transferase n=1 Tax=Salix brachista TaxID=2182728 RepID=A0A5N5JVN9_9ROSI|nr:hypothetical protein DKX38_026022 [Salix brachista]
MVVTLLDTSVSPFGMRVRIALEEKGVKYEYSEQTKKAKFGIFQLKNPQFSFFVCVYFPGRKTWTKKRQELEVGKNGLIESLRLLEGELGDKPYFEGDKIGYVDVALIPFCSWFHGYETFANFSIEAECPRLIAWCKRCMQNKSVSKSLADPQEVYGFLVELRKKFGLE